ncbi:hypothetical protein F2Q68_00040929 [Brassica cretica]|uniref:Uncharacterized protein n=1 Tax=Brassica cretica TaxID=69181 RepID=A0A8S9MNQ1_BRACR|nr:hypothetical protein F2Q68_00040929 [Brassica cretica]
MATFDILGSSSSSIADYLKRNGVSGGYICIDSLQLTSFLISSTHSKHYSSFNESPLSTSGESPAMKSPIPSHSFFSKNTTARSPAINGNAKANLHTAVSSSVFGFDLNLVLRRTYFNRHMLLRSTTVCLGSFDVHASQLHQNLVRVRVEPTVIVDTRISPKFVGDGPKLTEADIAICSCKVLVNPLLNETTTATQTTLTKAQHRD